MAHMREIRSRIKSVESTRQITKAMKMVSVAKMRRAQSASAGMDLYGRKTRELLDRLSASSVIAKNRFLTPHPAVRRVCYVLFVGNRGLCGTYNHTILRYARELLQKESRPWELLVAGRWGRDVLESEKLPVRQYFDLDDAPNPADAMRLTAALKELYLQGEADEVYLVYQKYRSALRQTPVSERLLPAVLPRPKGKVKEGAEEYIFEPSPEAVLDRLTEAYLYSRVFGVTRQTRIGEQAARMTAMTAAADATDELLAKLYLQLNRARQAAITTEISEIVGGAGALHEGSEE